MIEIKKNSFPSPHSIRPVPPPKQLTSITHRHINLFSKRPLYILNHLINLFTLAYITSESSTIDGEFGRDQGSEGSTIFGCVCYR